MLSTKSSADIFKIFSVSKRAFALSQARIPCNSLHNGNNGNDITQSSQKYGNCAKNTIHFKYPTRTLHVQIRKYSNGSRDTENEDVPMRFLAGPLQFIKSGVNLLMVKLWLKVNSVHFMEGAAHSFELITKCLSEGNIGDLDGLVTDNVMGKIKCGYGLCTASSHIYTVEKTKLLNMYVVQVDVDRAAQKEDGKKLIKVQILVVYMFKKDFDGKAKIYDQYKELDSLDIANYRFVRHYDQQGPADQWMINHIKHFKVSDFNKDKPMD